MNTVFSSRTHAEQNRKIGAFRRAAYVGTLLGLFGIVACTATATVSTGPGVCGVDSALSCASGTTGYSCTGTSPPESFNSGLVCSIDNAGTGDYCCVTAACSLSAAVSCAQGDTGYSCAAGAASPATSSLTCTMTSANNVDLYCCSAAVVTAACNADTSVACQVGTGYTCTGSSQPEDADTTLVCSADQGSGQFCCVTGSTCSYDSSLACENGAAGYSCTGTSTPNSVDSSLICSEPNNANAYCCFTTDEVSGSTCAQDQSVTGCQPNGAGQESFGFSCTGTDTPQQDYSGITCSTGTPGTGNTLFCCVYN